MVDLSHGWCLVVPVKRLAVAKSRLTGSATAHRAELALAFAADTVSAALRTPGVIEVVAVTDDPDAALLLADIGARVVTDEPDAGLNPALRHGARVAGERHPRAGIGALSADLPALRPRELAHALTLAGEYGSAVVADAGGTGTTAYLVAAGPDGGGPRGEAPRGEAPSGGRTAFRPAFGPDSLHAHVSGGAHALAAAGLDSLRRDVDTPADLAEAVLLGVGPRTAEVVARMAALPR
jgi:2-phospho-L-lactate guanylyltransferase